MNKNYFSVDFFTKSISGTKASFNKASKGEGAQYEELTRLMAKHPDFKLVVKEQKHSKAKKQTYEGLDFDLMEDYISIQDNAAELMEEYKGVKSFAKEAGLSLYPTTKKWFLNTFEGFDVAEAKKEIHKVKFNTVVKKATVKVKKSNSNEELKVVA